MKRASINIFCIIIFLLSAISVKAQKKDLGVTEKMIYDFMLSADADKYGKTSGELVTNKLANIQDYLTEPGVMKYFTVEDTTDMRNQVDNRFSFKWDSVKMKGSFHVLDDNAIERVFNQRTDGWAVFKKRYGSGYAEYSLPLFSKNRSRVFIYKGFHCGSLCGDGYIFIFEKKDGAWNMIFQRMIWIS